MTLGFIFWLIMLLCLLLGGLGWRGPEANRASFTFGSNLLLYILLFLLGWAVFGFVISDSGVRRGSDIDVRIGR